MSGDPLEQAVRRVRAEGLVAYPTETVWGLGADARSEPAYRGAPVYSADNVVVAINLGTTDKNYAVRIDALRELMRENTGVPDADDDDSQE